VDVNKKAVPDMAIALTLYEIMRKIKNFNLGYVWHKHINLRGIGIPY
jgi:hypothetical protein